MKVATCSYRPEWHADWDALKNKLRTWVADAARQGAELLLFPEYAGCEAALIGMPTDIPPNDWARRMCDIAEEWARLNSTLAVEFDVHIVAGSLCDWNENHIVNRAFLCAPTGAVEWQDKLILTPYERDEMQIQPGAQLKLFNSSLGKIGVLICYDIEFPLQARALCEAGAQMILVPSATDFVAGQTRVRQSCRARAIENQCLIIQAPVLGEVPNCDILDEGTGCAAVFCPPDFGLPPNGIIAQGRTDEAAWIFATADPILIANSRESGQVNNFNHWKEQDFRLENVMNASLL